MQSKDNFTAEGGFKKINWRKQNTPLHWLRGQLFFTYLANAYIIVTGEIERFTLRVMSSLRAFIDNESLLNGLDNLVREEKAHAYQHACVSQDLKRHKYPISFMLHSTRLFFTFCYSSMSNKSRLALVLAMEFYAHQASKVVIEYNVFPENQLAIYDFLRWHAKEELMHTPLCFKLYAYVKGGYVRRIFMYLFFTAYIHIAVFFFMFIFFSIDVFYRRRPVSRPKKTTTLRLVFKNKSVIWQLLKNYFSFFKV